MGGTRRRNRYGGQCWCAITTAVLLLFSIAFLYTRLSSDPLPNPASLFDDPEDPPFLLDSDPDPDPRTTSSDDRIDELDLLDDSNSTSNEEEILRSLDSESSADDSHPSPSSYFFDHTSLLIRHSFDRRSIDDLDRWDGDDYTNPLFTLHQDPSTLAVASDDIPVDEDIRRKMLQVSSLEDALLLKSNSRVSPLRQGWGPWFDAKTDFLRKDKMFKSSLELLNPLNNILLQDPDTFGATPLTRGDKIVLKAYINRIKKAPSIGNTHSNARVNHTTFGRGVLILQQPEHGASTHDKQMKKSGVNHKESVAKMDKAVLSNGGQKWGHFPGLPPYLSFSNFMDSFFRKSKCSMRIFMVWNSPSWMFTIRHQRGLESLLYHHPSACVVIFSETIELDFFSDFVKDSFKVAVAMPNLEELLQDTPTSIFASVWHEWRRTRFYSIHYSELIRLAALYKYGGMYLDCDVVVLRPISPISNSVGMEDSSPESPLNGAVMAFTKHSSFLMQCLSEFYSTYDDTLKRWNGAELLTRVARNFSRKTIDPKIQLELKVQPASIFFPISSYDIPRYFLSPLNDSEKANQDALFEKMMNESYTFHFWNSLTAALVPEPDSLVARTLNHFCTRCSDLL